MQAKYLKSRGDLNIDRQNWDPGVLKLICYIRMLQDPTGL